MYRYIAHANIDHYLDLLDDHDLASDKRTIIAKLLIDEMDKLPCDPEQLQFVQAKAAHCQERLRQLRRVTDDATGAENRAQSEYLLESFAALHQLIDDFCHRLQAGIKAGP